MSPAQRFGMRAALSATVIIGGWGIGLLAGLGSAGTGNVQAVSIVDRGSLHSIKAVAADLEPVDPPQATAMLSITNVATPVRGPEPMEISAALTHVTTDDLASLKAIDSVAEVVNPEPTSSTVAPTDMSVNKAAPAHGHSSETPVVLASVPTPEISVSAPLSDTSPPLREMRSLGSLFTSDPLKQNAQPVVRPLETPSECPAPEICIDDYLWAMYEHTPKIDTNKVVEQIKVEAKATYSAAVPNGRFHWAFQTHTRSPTRASEMPDTNTINHSSAIAMRDDTWSRHLPGAGASLPVGRVYARNMHAHPHLA